VLTSRIPPLNLENSRHAFYHPKGIFVVRSIALFVCAVALSAFSAQSQSANSRSSANIAPLRVSAGTIVNFQLQTRMKGPATAGVLDGLPKGTMLRVKLLDSIDSAADRDGSAFRGLIVSSVAWGDRVVIHSDAQVRGLFALLRSSSHPEGFEYQLLVTGLVDRGQAYTLTAFLDPNSPDAPVQSSTRDDSRAPSHN
jgi:hypothetical protein